MKNLWKSTIIIIVILFINIRPAFAGVPLIYFQNEANYPPYRFEQDNHYEGFEVELSNLIFRSSDYNVHYSTESWERAYDNIKTGKVDTCGLLAVTEDRKKEVLYSKTVLQSCIGIYSKALLKDITLDNIKNYRIAVGKDQFAELILKNDIGIENYVTYSSVLDAINALYNGEADVLFENQEVVDYLLIQNGLKGSIIAQVTNLFPIDIAYGVKTGNPKLVKYIDDRITEIQSSGVYEELYQKYFYSHSSYYFEMQRRNVQKLALTIALCAAVGFALLYIYIKYLKRKILKTNEELFEEHEKLKITVSSIDNGVVATNEKGIIEYANRIAIELIGLSKKDLIGEQINKIMKIINENTGERINIPIEKIINENVKIKFESNMLLVSNSGLSFSISASISPIKKDNDIVKGTVLIFQDITERKLAGDLIRYERDFSKSIFEYAKIFIEVWNTDGTLVKFNKYAQTVTGFTQDEVLGLKWMTTFADSSSIPQMMGYFEQLRSGILPPIHEAAIRCKNGDKIYVLWNNSIILDKDGKPDIIISMGIDFTDRKLAQGKLAESYQELEVIHEELTATEEELRAQFEELQKSQEALEVSEERYRLSVDGSNDGLFDYDIKSGTYFISNRCREILGFSEKEIPNNFEEWNQLIHSDDIMDFRQSLEDHIGGVTPFYKQEYRLKVKNGSYKWVLSRGKAIWDKHGKPMRIAGSITDISDRKRYEELIHSMAYYDSLTDLPNRVMLSDRLSAALSQASRENCMIGVLFMDLDNFKSVNDTLGHAFGDKLLKRVGERLRACTKEGDTIARLSGDEFILVLTGVKAIEDINLTADKIIGIFEQPISIGTHEIYITVSIGIAVYPNDGCDEEVLIRNADTAMYHSKETGKNNYKLYTKEMNTRIVKKLKLESDLRYAIKNGELTVYYQPLVDIKTGSIVGAEALIRWLKPGQQGYVPPMEFIPMAEETGLILPIGEFVLRTAIAQNKAWQNAGYPPIRVSVNLSVKQFQQQNLALLIRDILNETGLDPRWLAVEVTESIAMQDFELSIQVVEKLRSMGIEVSLDDFGTGFSSLNYLKKLPIDTLKIDKTFIDDITLESNQLTIIKAVLYLAHSMKLRVVAEGVETFEQMEILKGHNCDIAQGYLFSKPKAPGEIEELIRNGRVS